MRVRVNGLDHAPHLVDELRWRGVALDYFDGNAWTIARRRRAPLGRGSGRGRAGPRRRPARDSGSVPRAHRDGYPLCRAARLADARRGRRDSGRRHGSALDLAPGQPLRVHRGLAGGRERAGTAQPRGPRAVPPVATDRATHRGPGARDHGGQRRSGRGRPHADRLPAPRVQVHAQPRAHDDPRAARGVPVYAADRELRVLRLRPGRDAALARHPGPRGHRLPAGRVESRTANTSWCACPTPTPGWRPTSASRAGAPSTRRPATSSSPRCGRGPVSSSMRSACAGIATS